jgi:hypothetical protein
VVGAATPVVVAVDMRAEVTRAAVQQLLRRIPEARRRLRIRRLPQAARAFIPLHRQLHRPYLLNDPVKLAPESALKRENAVNSANAVERKLLLHRLLTWCTAGTDISVARMIPLPWSTTPARIIFGKNRAR